MVKLTVGGHFADGVWFHGTRSRKRFENLQYGCGPKDIHALRTRTELCYKILTFICFYFDPILSMFLIGMVSSAARAEIMLIVASNASALANFGMPCGTGYRSCSVTYIMHVATLCLHLVCRR